MIRKPVWKTARIPATDDTTNVIELRDYTAFGIITPVTLTSTTLEVQVSDAKAGTFVPLYDSEGNQVIITVTTSRAYGLAVGDADALACHQFARLFGNQTEVAARDIIFVMK